MPMRTMLTITPLLRTAGLNAVPILGVLLGGWEPPTALVIYLAETVLLIAFTAVRIALFAPARLETQNGATQSRAEFNQAFLLLAGSFTFGALVFNAFALWRIFDLTITWSALLTGLPILIGIELLALAGDWIFQRQADQAEAEAWVVRCLRRVFVLFFAVFGGFIAAAWGFEWFLLPFIALKVLMDIGIAAEQALGVLRRNPTPT
jgi:hypothetical protein